MRPQPRSGALSCLCLIRMMLCRRVQPLEVRGAIHQCASASLHIPDPPRLAGQGLKFYRVDLLLNELG
jgi:hypothetical protein